jgi:hypothetical protein
MTGDANGKEMRPSNEKSANTELLAGTQSKK